MSVSPFALERPFVGILHPQAEALRVYGRTWVQQVGLVTSAAELERFDAALYWQLIAEAYPTAPWEILTLAHDWSCWGFFLDDFDDSGHAARQPGALRQLFAQMLAILRDEPLPADPPLLLSVLANVWQRMRQHGDSTWRCRFHDTLAESLSAYQWEAQNRVNRGIPSVDAYIAYRRKTGGWRTLVLLVDLAEGRTMPEYLFHWPALQQLLDTANNIICWSNDLYSYEKERLIGEVHNLIPVVQAAYGCTEEAAIQRVVTWHNESLREWERWKQRVERMPMWLGADTEHLQAYSNFCKHYMRANDVWSQITGRYRPGRT